MIIQLNDDWRVVFSTHFIDLQNRISESDWITVIHHQTLHDAMNHYVQRNLYGLESLDQLVETEARLMAEIGKVRNVKWSKAKVEQ